MSLTNDEIEEIRLLLEHLTVKQGKITIKNIDRFEVIRKDIMPDLLRIIKENPPTP